MKSYYNSVKLSLEGISPNEVDEPFEMFQFYAAQLLSGEKTDKINDWLDKHIADYKQTKRLNIDLVEMTYLAALKELSGESGVAAAQKGLSFLQSNNEIDEEQYQIVESALALAFLTEDSKLIKRFFEAGLKLFDNEKTLTFELLFLARFRTAKDDVLDRLADIVARTINHSLWSLPLYSAAPHVCVLSALAGKSNIRSRGLLKNRLKKMDDEIFEAAESPKLKFSKQDYRLTNSDKRNAVLTVRQKITGKGVLNAGLYELKEITSYLPQTIQTAAEEAKIRRSKIKRNRSVLLENALENKNGEFRTVLDLSKNIELLTVDKELLQKRFDLGWEIAKSHNGKLLCGHKLELTVPNFPKK